MASYEQSKSSKLWSVRFRTMVGGKEINKRLSGFRTKKEAEAGYRAFLANTDPEKLAVGGLRFDELVAAYIAYLRTTTKESTVYTLEGKIKGHIAPYFGTRFVHAIKPIDVLEWQNTLTEYSYTYRLSLRGQLSALLRHADRYYDIPSIMSKIAPLRNTEPVKEMQCWSEEEFGAFYAAIPEDQTVNRLYFLTLYLLGCRKGEGLALTWADVDLDKKTVSITKNITRKVAGAPYAVTTPKNRASNRKITIPDSLCAAFQKYRQSLGKGATAQSFVFGGDTPLKDRTIDRAFATATEQAGVSKIRIHDLRHSCASLLISHGVSIVAVSKRLGHKNVEQTLNTYAHLMPRDDDLMLQIADDIVGALGTV